MWIKVDTRRPLAILIVALSALAWLALWLGERLSYGAFLSHEHVHVVDNNGFLIGLFIVGWVVMVIAMMLPTSLPLMTMFQALVRQRADRALLVGLLIGGYLASWTVFGAFAYSGDWLLHHAVDRSAWLHDHEWMIWGLTLAVAGAYQFTPLKYRCLDKCRSPLSFIAEHWRGQNERWQSLALGAHHGLFCIGCCWALMLLMFAFGATNLGWMLMLGIVMAIEKNMPWGRRLIAPLGIGLLAWGVFVLLFGAPLEHIH